MSIVDVAMTQIGTVGGEKYNRWYYGNTSNDNASWCASFVSWCAAKANINPPIIPKSSSVAAMQAAFGSRFHSSAAGNYVPVAGDIIFFNPSHVGIVVSYNASTQRVNTIEGNFLTNGKHVVASVSRAYNGKINSSSSLSTRGYGAVSGGVSSRLNAIDPDAETIYSFEAEGQRVPDKRPSGGYMIYWCGKRWLINEKYLKPADSFRTGYQLKTNGNFVIDGATAITPLGVEAQSVSFSYVILNNVLNEMQQLRDLVGAVDYLYLGSGRVGKYMFRLINVAFDEATPLPDGELNCTKATLTLTEDVLTSTTPGLISQLKSSISAIKNSYSDMVVYDKDRRDIQVAKCVKSSESIKKGSIVKIAAFLNSAYDPNAPWKTGEHKVIDIKRNNSGTIQASVVYTADESITGTYFLDALSFVKNPEELNAR